ncbi:MAG: 4-alpha-glucanotransferase, partial [Acidobacteria bacterium]|nr:4-alpha-glucanotransferase [Acidobacteriota bacterium]
MSFTRGSGILMHPTSLPGGFGIGDLGKSAYNFVDFLSRASQAYWQVLPLGPTGYGDSPYQCFSAFAGNTNLISPDILLEMGILDSADIFNKPNFSDKKVDYGKVISWKTSILEKAYRNFSETAGSVLSDPFENFKAENAYWLNDYAVFRAVKDSQKGKMWLDWANPLRNWDRDSIEKVCIENSEQIDAQKFYQFLFFDQWGKLKKYANENGIQIIGDIPIFVSLDSVDVWCNRHEFKLNEDLTPKVLSGVPPDYFSKTGQLWGNPIYDWDSMSASGFRWWVSRAKFNFRMFDIVRIDHFRGFSASWEVPGGDKTAENGTWVDVPGEQLFQTLEGELGKIPVIAEDLGVITPDVEQLRDRFGFPGMRILQYGFGGDARNRDLPHNYTNNCVAYTGTHDNETAAGWFSSQKAVSSARNEAEISNAREYCL